MDQSLERSSGGFCVRPVVFLVFINNLDQGIASNILKFAYDT